VAKEVGTANALADKNSGWQEQRHRCVQRGVASLGVHVGPCSTGLLCRRVA
jgi:hypothetical protein